MKLEETTSKIVFRTFVTCFLFFTGWPSLADVANEQTQIQRFVDGIDAGASPMASAEVELQLNDPWAQIALRKGHFPKTVEASLLTLAPNEVRPGLPEQASFFVSESGQISSSPVTAALQRSFRMVVTRSSTEDGLPEFLLSAPAGDRSGFIEVMSWDATKWPD